MTVHTAYHNCSDPICLSRGALSFSWISALFSVATTLTAIHFAIQMVSYNMMTFCCCRLYWILWGRDRNIRSWNALPSLQRSQNSKVCVSRPSVYCNFPLDTLQRRSVCFLNNVWHGGGGLCVCCVRKWQTKKIYVKSNLNSQTETDFQKCDLSKISKHRFVKVRFHMIFCCSHLLITIGYAQKLDLDRQPEQVSLPPWLL